MPPYVPAVVLTVVVAYLADRLKWRGPFILICLPLAIIGKHYPRNSTGHPSNFYSLKDILSRLSLRQIAPGMRLCFSWQLECPSIYCCRTIFVTEDLKYCRYPSGPSILSILPNNTSGHYKRATTTALQLAIANTSWVQPDILYRLNWWYFSFRGFVATFVYTAGECGNLEWIQEFRRWLVAILVFLKTMHRNISEGTVSR